jgi:hypothetical protein
MKILFLTYYFEPDLCAGSFRNTSLLNELVNELKPDDVLEVITTQPNRYDSYKVQADDYEVRNKNVHINRIKIPDHKSGLFGQIKSFKTFYEKAFEIAKKKEYNLVYASSSRLFTGFLGARLAAKNKAKLYLDIRDIFRESIAEIFKNPVLKLTLNVVLKPIENYTFGKANHINLVSKGFESYFSEFSNCSYSFFTNGIDAVFLEQNKEEEKELSTKKTVVYAGNIGEGQGLDIIIPVVAKALSKEYEFIIYGDGGAKDKLVAELEKNNITNVYVRKPINRSLLIEEYQKADFLFLHLNKYKAFERVLPSKLFEYGAFNKPIIAGVSGFSAEFIKTELDNFILFEPGDANTLVNSLQNFDYKKTTRNGFISKFSRKKINIEMSKSILSLQK